MESNKIQETIFIVPFDEVSTGVLNSTGKAITTQLPVEYILKPTLDIAPAAYNEKRDQYHSTILLNLLIEHYGKRADRILGITERDLYVPELNFVFGEADMVHNVAVISLARLRQEHYGLPPDEELFEKRALTEAVHELGHTYGLRHCPNPDCVMYFSNTLADTDRKGYTFCDKCMRKLNT